MSGNESSRFPPLSLVRFLLRLSTLKNTALLRSELTGPSYTYINMFGEAKYYFLLIFFFFYYYFRLLYFLSVSRTLSRFIVSFNRRDLRVKKFFVYKRLTCCARLTNNRDEYLS